jgi:hypothetical protein
MKGVNGFGLVLVTMNVLTSGCVWEHPDEFFLHDIELGIHVPVRLHGNVRGIPWVLFVTVMIHHIGVIAKRVDHGVAVNASHVLRVSKKKDPGS